jgi:hypothetical protein
MENGIATTKHNMAVTQKMSIGLTCHLAAPFPGIYSK